MSLKAYAELGHVHRTEPCQEYPGQWLLCLPNALKEAVGEYQESHTSQESARLHGEEILNRMEADLVEYNPRDIGVCWQASDNDPRIGQVWFTGFYQHGHWNHYGQYRTT